MKFIRPLMSVLAAVHLLFAAVVTVVGLFADGSWWERIPTVIVHPIAAVVLLVVVIRSGPVSKLLRCLTLTMLAANVAVDIIWAVLIAAGAIRGDWYLPLFFSIVPAVGSAYVWKLRTG